MLSALLREWLKLQVKLGLPVYFRQLPVTGTSTIPASGPILFAANHQNSFLDALIVTITQPREMHYLVRSDVFRKPWADRMLRMLNMLPVFRIRDGWHTLGNNAPTFARCVEIFRSGGA
ncbi:MAG: 1-acyl-sn-glycerol-3-phosphate acyltransferase, partial [Bacteroidota bacterium]